MGADGSAVLSIEPDGRLILESTAGKIHRLSITQGPDGLEHRWTVDGGARPFDAHAREWRDLMLKILHGYEESSRIRGEDARLRARIAAHRGRIATMHDLIDYYRERVRQGELEERDIEDRVARIQVEIDEYDLDEKIARLETAVAALEVERRAREIEDALDDDIARLRRLVDLAS